MIPLSVISPISFPLISLRFLLLPFLFTVMWHRDRGTPCQRQVLEPPVRANPPFKNLPCTLSLHHLQRTQNPAIRLSNIHPLKASFSSTNDFARHRHLGTVTTSMNSRCGTFHDNLDTQLLPAHVCGHVSTLTTWFGDHLRQNKGLLHCGSPS